MTGICAFETLSDVSNRRKAPVADRHRERRKCEGKRALPSCICRRGLRPEQTFLFICSDLVGDRPAARRSSAQPCRGRAPSESWTLTSMRAEIGLGHKGAFARLSTKSSRPWTLAARTSLPAAKEEAR